MSTILNAHSEERGVREEEREEKEWERERERESIFTNREREGSTRWEKSGRGGK